MVDMVVSILVSFPIGARSNLRNTAPPGHKCYEMWMVVVGAMLEVAGLGRHWSL